jgi:hypothetical protein
VGRIDIGRSGDFPILPAASVFDPPERQRIGATDLAAAIIDVPRTDYRNPGPLPAPLQALAPDRPCCTAWRRGGV